MPKLQELFVRPDGSKILDTKLLVEVVEMPKEPTIETSSDGASSYENFYVKLSHQGQVYDFKCNASQLARIFTHKKKTGEIFWQAKNGEHLNFWYASNQKMPNRPYFAAEPIREGDTAAMAMAVFGDDEGGAQLTVSPVTPAKPVFAKSNAGGFRKTEETKWDGSPRDSSFRQGLAGMLQSMYSNPNVNPLDDAHRAAVKKICDEEVAYVRYQSKVLASSITD